MKPEDIKLWDWHRMFIGEVPPVFLLEIMLRMTLVYIILMASMRLLGKRMAAQLTRNELAAMVSLAAAVGVPILSPDRGILPSFVIAIVVVSISRGIALISARSQKSETITQGRIDTLVKDGVMDLKTMTKTRITKERIMAQLRYEKLKHLGEVKRLFIEANGIFTLIKSDKPKPGLPVIPESDKEFLKQLKPNGIMVCYVCGRPRGPGKPNQECPNCRHINWVIAVQ
ncbi:DUF421 domain-containing protein [Chryseosolibacter indicus]|uniref:DUF421 domain-containing protein n=1 Tax=Chryseosolibacter indicus TaxID=2782351 RepID=A0ABS5VPU2_9BACT|nr:YetF domain-containing protein [Chryseosolibacter indicus]MBT1702869.1 DUF421 domain-containing protein [Chryseosolibacter indicus]